VLEYSGVYRWLHIILLSGAVFPPSFFVVVWTEFVSAKNHYLLTIQLSVDLWKELSTCLKIFVEFLA